MNQSVNESTLYTLPSGGDAKDEILRKVRELKAAMTPTDRGKLSSTAFQARDDMAEVVYQSALAFMGWNGLFTFQEAAAARMENEVLDICIGLVTGGEPAAAEQARANFTSGGTQSNFCALFAMRGWARKNKPDIREPEIVAPGTIRTCDRLVRSPAFRTASLPRKH